MQEWLPTSLGRAILRRETYQLRFSSQAHRYWFHTCFILFQFIQNPSFEVSSLVSGFIFMYKCLGLDVRARPGLLLVAKSYGGYFET